MRADKSATHLHVQIDGEKLQLFVGFQSAAFKGDATVTTAAQPNRRVRLQLLDVVLQIADAGGKHLAADGHLLRAAQERFDISKVGKRAVGSGVGRNIRRCAVSRRTRTSP